MRAPRRVASCNPGRVSNARPARRTCANVRPRAFASVRASTPVRRPPWHGRVQTGFRTDADRPWVKMCLCAPPPRYLQCPGVVLSCRCWRPCCPSHARGGRLPVELWFFLQDDHGHDQLLPAVAQRLDLVEFGGLQSPLGLALGPTVGCTHKEKGAGSPWW